MSELKPYSPENYSSKKERSLMPTSEQMRAAELDFYIKRVNIFEKGSKSYINWKKNFSGQTVNEGKKSLKEKASTAFEELYKADGKTEDLRGFRSKWGQDAVALESIFDGFKPDIISSKEQATGNPTSISKKDRIMISIRAAKTLSKLSPDQKDQMFATAGYSKKDISDITKKIGISAGLNTGLYWGFQAVVVAAAGAGAIKPYLGDLSDSKTIAAIALGYIAYFSSLGINAQQNLRLLRNESINTSPSIAATTTFFLLKKLLPHNEKWQNLGTRLSSPALELIKEAFWFATMFIPVVGPSISVSSNMAASGLYDLQAIASEVVLRRHKKPKQ